MIRMQIAEKGNRQLFRELKAAMRSGALRTFSLEKRGRKVVHARYPGWMNWSYRDGVVSCEVLSPRKPGHEWQFLSAFVGRLADRFPDRIESISIRFSEREAR
jgi:hypothetical protein